MYFPEPSRVATEHSRPIFGCIVLSPDRQFPCHFPAVVPIAVKRKTVNRRYHQKFAIKDTFVRRILMTLRRLYGLPCWGVQRGYGSFLTLEFGHPHLRIREPFPTDSASRRLQELAAKRLIRPAGDFHLWIYACDWAVFEGSRLVGDSGTRRRIDRAASYLNGQKLLSAQLILRGMRTILEFDLGGRLETKSYDRKSVQWLLYEPQGKVLTVRADKRYSYGPGDRPADQERWREIEV